MDQQIEETKPTWIHELSTNEYVEQVDEKEMLKELFEDQQDKTEDLKDLKTLKAKPATIPQWPRHIASYHGQVEGSEVFIDCPNSPTYQPPPVRPISESTWIEVIPDEIKVTSDDEVGTTPKIETPPSQDVVKYEMIPVDETAEAIDGNSEGEGEGNEVVPDDETAEAIDGNSEGEREGKVEEIGGEDEEGRIKTAKVKDAYVAIRKLRIQGWKIREKTFKQKQKKKKKETKWMFEKDREDKDWKPPRSRRKKMKTPRIKLVRRRPISDDEEETEPSYRQSLQRRAWAGTTLRHQSEVITFYKTLHKLKVKEIKEGKRRQRKRRREEEQGARGEVTAPTSEAARKTPRPGRQLCLRKSGSGVWETEGRGGRADEREQRQGLEVNPEATQSKVYKIGHMERSEEAEDKVVVNTREAAGQDLEKKSSTRQSPSRETKNGYRGEAAAKGEEGQGGEEGGPDPPREWSKEGEYPGRGRRAAEEGETSEEAKKDKFHRPPPVAAPTDLITPTGQTIGMKESLAEMGVRRSPWTRL